MDCHQPCPFHSFCTVYKTRETNKDATKGRTTIDMLIEQEMEIGTDCDLDVDVVADMAFLCLGAANFEVFQKVNKNS